MSYNVISNTRQMFTENFYLVTEELCHTTPSEMINATKSLLNTVKEVALKTDILIQTLFEKENRDDIFKTLAEVCAPICEIIKGTPKHPVTWICSAAILLTSCFGAYSEIESAFIYAGFAFAGIQTMGMMGAEISAMFNFDFDMTKEELKGLAKTYRYAFYTTCISTLNARLIAPSNVGSAKAGLFFQNFVYATTFILTVPIPSLILHEIPFYKFKGLMPQINNTYARKMEGLNLYKEYKKTDQLLKEIDPRMISSFENNVADIVHDYVGVKAKSLTPLHVKARNKVINYVGKNAKALNSLRVKVINSFDKILTYNDFLNHSWSF